MLYPIELRAPLKIGRGREIRTPDILLPKQARYQTALYPDSMLTLLQVLLHGLLQCTVDSTTSTGPNREQATIGTGAFYLTSVNGVKRLTI